MSSVLPDSEVFESCLLSHRPRLQRQLAGLVRRQQQGKPFDRGLAQLNEQISQSQAVAESRRFGAAIGFDPALPISERQDEIRALIEKHQVIVLCGETGSGKSTQLPKICLAAGRGRYGRIGHTQPRRIAARSLAMRISEELGRELGSTVGYKVRFKDRVQPNTAIKLLTDGMLLAEVQRDRLLLEYDTLIIDEAHERSLNIDFLLGYLKQLLPQRPELKLIVTSATIDPDRFSAHFEDAPVINVSGRTYPVEVHYREPAEGTGSERDEGMQQAIVDAVDELSRIDRGDILIFLSGEREIRETAETLHKHRLQATEILPLYARLSPAEQGRIFHPGAARRIVLATNVAETSLTVPGIRYVIDAGFARISRYSHRAKVQRLPVERISRASADQRKGRCGRVAAGVCIRLYSEDDFNARAKFTEPEILRTNLASVILQMKLLGFGEIERFPFIEPPEPRQINDGYRLLEELGAVDGERRISRLGRQLARLPVDPRIARMLLEATQGGCLRELLVIASALSVQDVRDRPLDKQQAADEAQAEFRDERSDFIGYLKLWQAIEEQRRHLSRRKFQSWCRSRFLSWTRVQEWHDIHQQLRAEMHAMGFRDNQQEPGYDAIHMAVLSGLLSHIGLRAQTKGKASAKEYLGGRNSRFLLHPSSGVYAKPPKWLVAAELVETTRLYGRTIAEIRPEWIESLAGHLVKRSYSEPHWQGKRGQVGGYVKISLFGLPVVPRRRVNFGPVDPAQSREIFIRFALVGGDFHSRARFWRHNQQLIEQVRDMEARSRRRDILIDEEAIYAFYDARVPDGIYSSAQFEKWLREAVKDNPRILHMDRSDLMRRELAADELADYPDSLRVGEVALPLEYHFEPGQDSDGVSLRVPLAMLRQVPDALGDYLVPGLLRERIETLLRGLPKSLRRNFVPVPDTAARVARDLQPSDTPLVQALGAALKRLTGVHVPEDAWQLDALPPHLQLGYRVVDDDGRTLAQGRELHALQQRFKDARPAASSSGDSQWQREGVTEWDFGTLPERVEIKRGGIRMPAFPALVDRGERVDLQLLDNADEAAQAHHGGLRRLLMLKLPRDIRYLRKQLTGLAQMRLQYAKAPQPKASRPIELEDELVGLIVDRCFLADVDASQVRTAEALDSLIETQKGQLVSVTNQTREQVAELLALYQQARKALDGLTQLNWMASAQDMRQQLDALVYRGFLQQTPAAQLTHYPRYLRAMLSRIDKLAHAAARDQQWLRELAQVLEPWQARVAALKGRRDPRLEEIGWLIEELRVSLFAQELKTAQPVSVKRIQKRWRELGL